jgi:phosphinothricin acetyltransferase
VDVSVYVDVAERGRGIGHALYSQLLPEVRRLGYVSAFAGVALPNDASVRLHESLGFAPVGVFRNVGFKHGEWRDVGWWQLTWEPLPASPAEPREWSGP